LFIELSLPNNKYSFRQTQIADEKVQNQSSFGHGTHIIILIWWNWTIRVMVNH